MQTFKGSFVNKDIETEKHCLSDITGSTDQPCLPCLAELHQVCQWSRDGGTKGIYVHLITIHVEPDCLLQYVPGKCSLGFDLMVLGCYLP